MIVWTRRAAVRAARAAVYVTRFRRARRWRNATAPLEPCAAIISSRDAGSGGETFCRPFSRLSILPAREDASIHLSKLVPLVLSVDFPQHIRDIRPEAPREPRFVDQPPHGCRDGFRVIRIESKSNFVVNDHPARL